MARRVNKYGRRDRRATLDSQAWFGAPASVCRVKSTLMAVFYIGIDLHRPCGELEVKSSMFSLSLFVRVSLSEVRGFLDTTIGDEMETIYIYIYEKCDSTFSLPPSLIM